MRNKLISVALLAIMVAGCGQKVQTFEYYKAHIDEARTEYNTNCLKVPDKDRDSDTHQNCQNAASALLVNSFSKGATSAPKYGTYKLNTTIYP